MIFWVGCHKNDKIIYKKQEALSPSTVYPSTKGEKKQITVRFAAKNFKNSNKGEYLITSINFIISNAEDHLKYKTNKYSIVRYNSLYEALKKEDEEKKGAKEKRYSRDGKGLESPRVSRGVP